ncbi:hypothetical protein ACP70R_032785 [Stipagrostis hirtigluma subsp. patula]
MSFVVCDPLSGSFVLLPAAPTYELDHESAYLGAALLTEDAGAVDGGNDAGQGVMPMLGGVGGAAHANGRVYWVIDDEDDDSASLMVLDTRTKEFSTIDLLASMRNLYDGNMRVMRTENGDLRIVALTERMALHFWRLDRSRSARGRWVREEVLEVADFHGVLELFADRDGCPTLIMDAGEGFVFLKHYPSDWVFALSLRDMRMLRLPHSKCSLGPALPYRLLHSNRKDFRDKYLVIMRKLFLVATLQSSCYKLLEDAHYSSVELEPLSYYSLETQTSMM